MYRKIYVNNGCIIIIAIIAIRFNYVIKSCNYAILYQADNSIYCNTRLHHTYEYKSIRQNYISRLKLNND